MNKSSAILHLQDWSNCLTTRRRIPRHFYHFKTANSNDDNEMANSSATLSLRNLITILIVVQYLQDFTFLTYNFNDLPRGLSPNVCILNFLLIDSTQIAGVWGTRTSVHEQPINGPNDRYNGSKWREYTRLRKYSNFFLTHYEILKS